MSKTIALHHIATVASIAELMDRFYKHDRLNRPGGTRERLIADREQSLKAPETWRVDGKTLMISYHDSATGWGIYATQQDKSILVFQERSGQVAPASTVVANADATSSHTVLECFVTVKGDATDPDDEGVQGTYSIVVKLDVPVPDLGVLTPSQRSEIAAAVLDCFHENQGIEVLDDFSISAYLPDGSPVDELDGDVTPSGISPVASYYGQTDPLALPVAAGVV